MKKTVKTVLVLMLMLITAFAFTVQPAAAATKKMTAYDQVIKKGKYAYCASGWVLARVNLKTNKVKVLRKTQHAYPGSMKIKGKYIYFIEGTEGTVSYLKRIKVTGGKAKKLTSDNVVKYAIKGNKIYYTCVKDVGDVEKSYRKVMKLNGKGKKSTNQRVKMKTKKSNVKGYRTFYKVTTEKVYDEKYGDYEDDEDDEDYDDYEEISHMKVYLKTPKKTILLYSCTY